jgi:hypothetical protein
MKNVSHRDLREHRVKRNAVKEKFGSPVLLTVILFVSVCSV